MPGLKVEDITKLAKDALYVGVGLGVIGFQKAQVQRNELQKQLKGQVGDARTQLDGLQKVFEDRVKLLEERLQGVEGRFESLLDQLEERLPEQAKEVSRQARTAAKDAREQVRGIVNRAS
jgi:ElaB/YqjD/DUF883 family membrane-anchored ribosome-binding protein